MPYCVSCGGELNPDWSVCPNCGTHVSTSVGTSSTSVGTSQVENNANYSDSEGQGWSAKVVYILAAIMFFGMTWMLLVEYNGETCDMARLLGDSETIATCDSANFMSKVSIILAGLCAWAAMKK